MKRLKEFLPYVPAVIALQAFLFFGMTAVWVSAFLTILISGCVALYRSFGDRRILELLVASLLVTTLTIGSLAGVLFISVFHPSFVSRVKNLGANPPATLLASFSLMPALPEMFQTVIGGPGFTVRVAAWNLDVVRSTGTYTVCTVTGTGDMTIWGIAAIPTTTVSTASTPTIAIQDNNATVNTWLSATATTNMTAGRAITMTNPALRQITLNTKALQFVVGTATITTGAITLIFGYSITSTSGAATANCV